MTLRIGYRQDLVSMVYSRGIRETADLFKLFRAGVIVIVIVMVQEISSQEASLSRPPAPPLFQAHDVLQFQ